MKQASVNAVIKLIELYLGNYGFAIKCDGNRWRLDCPEGKREMLETRVDAIFKACEILIRSKRVLG